MARLVRDCTCLGKATPVVVVLAAFQFWHWFRPSEPFLVDILNSDFHLPEAVVYNNIYPWSTYALLPATLLSAALFEVFGFGSALMVAAVGDVVTVFLVILSSGKLGPLWASQVTFALSFAAVFSVVATLFALLPPDLYQKASSYSRAASLMGTIVSSLVGQGLASSGLRWWTLWGTVAGTVISLAVILVALSCRLLKPYGYAATRTDAALALVDEVAEGVPASETDNNDGANAPRAFLLRDGSAEPQSLPASPDHSIRELDRSLHLPVAAALERSGGDGDAFAPIGDPDHSIGAARGSAGALAGDTSDDVASVATSEGSSLWGIKPSEATPSRVYERMSKVLASAWVSYSSPVVLGLSLWSAALRAAHTLALTYWQPLLDELRPVQDGSGNGTIYAAAYICAAAATCAPALLESLSASQACGQRCEAPTATHSSARCGSGVCGLVLLGAGSLVASGALAAMASATSVSVAATALIAFHSTGELLLVVSAAVIGREMVRQEAARVGGKPDQVLACPDRRPVRGIVVGLTNGAFDAPLTKPRSESAVCVEAGPLGGAQAGRRAGKGVYFAAVLGINALLGMVMQLVVQTAVGTGAARLGLAGQYGVFAGVVLLGCVLGVMVPALAACFATRPGGPLAPR